MAGPAAEAPPTHPPTCRRAASSHTSSLLGHSSQPFIISSRACSSVGWDGMRWDGMGWDQMRRPPVIRGWNATFPVTLSLAHDAPSCTTHAQPPSTQPHHPAHPPAACLLQLAGHLLQACRRDPAGRVPGVCVDHRLEQQARLLDVADLGVCRRAGAEGQGQERRGQRGSGRRGGGRGRGAARVGALRK